MWPARLQGREPLLVRLPAVAEIMDGLGWWRFRSFRSGLVRIEAKAIREITACRPCPPLSHGLLLITSSGINSPDALAYHFSSVQVDEVHIGAI